MKKKIATPKVAKPKKVTRKQLLAIETTVRQLNGELLNLQDSLNMHGVSFGLVSKADDLWATLDILRNRVHTATLCIAVANANPTAK